MQSISTTPIFRVALLLVATFFCSLVIAPTAYAVCPAGNQEVSIGFPGAVQSADGKTWCVPINPSSPDITQNPIWILLRTIVQFMAAGVGFAVVGGIIFGGFTYMTARGNSAQTQKAIELIRNAVIGLLLYIFMFAILNFVIPGGILS